MRSLDYMNRVEAYVNRLNSERRTVLETIQQVRFLDLMADELNCNDTTTDCKEDENKKPDGDTSKDDTTKDDNTKDDTSKDDTSKDDASKDDNAKDDTSKDDNKKDDVPSSAIERPFPEA